MKFFFDQDSSCHWYIVESAHRTEWQKWRDLDEDLEEAWTHPPFAKPIDGYPTRYDFENPTLSEP